MFFFSFLGSTYLNNTIGGVLEIVTYIVLLLTSEKVSRKKSLGLSLLVGGIACLVSTVFNNFADSYKSTLLNLNF